ncbi:hypothetical protein [Phyllobacterium salinisoli]|uniref:hypothetical protein n=1 Tax=Phyllobacterium salinisoli TaxID=1899321 RepID=UPI00190F7333|nr:hypothetical protein [Phyllobacterium salinisoli]
MAKRFGPAKPRGVTWKGAGGCAIFSHSRQEHDNEQTIPAAMDAGIFEIGYRSVSGRPGV